MFKKDQDVASNTLTLLKNKEIKKLKRDLLSQWSRMTAEDIDTLFVSASRVATAKLESRTILYYIDDVVYIFDVEGRNKYFPSVALLWKFPNCLRQIRIPSPVSEYILRGADLFSPGLASLEGLESLLRSEKVALIVTGNPMPFAVGESNVSYEAILVNRGQGKAVNVMHFYGDKLCKNIPGPNLGFNLRVISPILSDESTFSTEEAGERSSQQEEEVPQNEAALVSANIESSATDNTGDMTSSLIDDEEVAEDELSIDEVILRGLLLALRYLIKDDQLPFLASNLWKLVQKAIICDPEHTYRPVTNTSKASSAADDETEQITSSMSCSSIKDTIPSNQSSSAKDSPYPTPPDIKKSKYKQVSVLLSHASKDLEVLGMMNEEGIINIISINRRSHHFKRVTLKQSDSLDKFKLAITAYSNYISNEKLAENNAATSSMLSTLIDGKLSSVEDLNEEHFFQSNIKKGAKKGNVIKVLTLYKYPRQYRDVFARFINEANASMISYQEHRQAIIDGRVSANNITEVFTFQEVKDIFLQFIDHYELLSREDKRCLVIPSNNPLYPLIPSSLSTQSTQGMKSKEDVRHVPQIYEAEESDERQEDYDEAIQSHEDPYDDGDSSDFPALSSISKSSQVVGGVVMSSISSQSTSAKDTSKGPSQQAKKEWKPIYLTKPTSSSREKDPRSQQSAIHVDNTKAWARSDDAKSGSSNAQTNAWPLPSETSSISHKNGPVESSQSIVIRKDELLNEIIKRLTIYNAIVSNQGAFKLSHGKPPAIQLTTQKRAGNKIVTTLRGLESFGLDLDGLVKDFKKKFACSVTIGTVKGIEKESEIIVQGSANVREILMANYGIPGQNIVSK